MAEQRQAPPAPLQEPGAALAGERRALVEETRKWGYFFSDLVRLSVLFRGRRVLDVGMGGGPYAVAYVESGAVGYVGVDPLLGTSHVHDLRSFTDPSFPAYHAFPYSVDDIQRLYPELSPIVGDGVIGQAAALG
jgi:hypothetical protein